MRKYMIVLPWLLFSGLVVAKDVDHSKQQGDRRAVSTAADKKTKLADPSNRFHMTQDGKRMTADDFDAWMKKNGYRVAGGAKPETVGSVETVKKGR